MKKLFVIFGLITANLIQAQNEYADALSITLNKQQIKTNNYVDFVDASKQILLPTDGMFLYSSLNNEGNSNIGYGSNENYEIIITNPAHQKMRIRTDYIALDNQSDEILFYDGESAASPLLASYKGVLHNNQLIVSSSDKITISFKSDATNNGRGFRLRIDQANMKSYSLSTTTCLNSTPAADACVNAPVICNLNGYCGNTSGQYTADNTNIPGFCGSIENNSWLSFIASSTTAQFEFTSAGCQSSGSGIQALIYASTNCSNFTQVSNCVSQGSSSGSFTITTNTALVPGTKYYIMVDGYAGNVCDYSVTAQSGVLTSAQIIASNNPICPGVSTQLGASVVSTSYTWTSSDGSVFPNTATISVSPTVTTTYTLALGASDCFPSGSMGVQTITVSSTLPPPNISAPNGACINGNVTLTSITNGGTYLWTGPNGFSSTLQNPTINSFNTINAGTYSLVISYGSSCTTQQGTVNVTTLATPTVAITSAPSNAVCLGNDVTLTASGGTQLNAYTWSWNSNEASVALESCILVFGVPICNPILAIIPGTGSGPSAVVTPSMSTQVCVSVSNSSGCIGTTCQNITVLSSTSLTASPSVTTCAAQAVTLWADGASSYTWEPSASVITTSLNMATVNPSVTTIYTVTGVGCGSVVLSNTVVVVVGSNPPLVSAIQSPSLVCPNQTDVAFLVNNISNTTYNWTLPFGAIITSTNSSSNEVVANMGTTAGIFTIAVTATNSCGSTTKTSTIQVTQIQVVASSSSPTLCAPGSVTLNVAGASWYNWLPTTGLSVSSGTNITYVASPASTTQYTVTGTQGACINSTVVTVNVINNFVTITATPNSVCAGQSTQLQASSSTATSYTWSNGSTLSSITVTPGVTTTYTIIGNSACPEKGSITITVNPNPNISINSPSICANQSATLIASGATSYTWSTGATTSQMAVIPAGSTTYSVIGTNNFGCLASQVTQVTVYNPIADFTGIDNNVQTIGTTLNLINTSSGSSIYFWKTCTDIATTTNHSILLADTGICCIELVATQQQCKDTVTKCLNVILPTHLIVPNVFTPNGDGKNDVFILDATNIGEINFSVFNRWGIQIYEAHTSGNIKWDGKTKGGSLVNDGTYFYVIDAKGLDSNDYNLKGFITVFVN